MRLNGRQVAIAVGIVRAALVAGLSKNYVCAWIFGGAERQRRSTQKD